MPLLPEQLRSLWQQVTDGRLTDEQAMAEQTRLIDLRKRTWTAALIEPGHTSLRASLLREMADYLVIANVAVVEQRCQRVLSDLKDKWTSTVDPNDPTSVEQYYRSCEGVLYELTAWHSLADDDSPLGYVNALELAQQYGCRSYLDFASGVGSGGLLFRHAGFDVTLADISEPLLAFCKWRFARRNLPGRFIDLKTAPLPENAFDVITAMDVFEHLTDPVKTVEELFRSLKPSGLFIARLHADDDPDRPQHIVADFEPVLRRIAELGGQQVWVDDWLWGHQGFRKA